MNAPAQSSPIENRFNIQPLPNDSFTYFHILAAASDLSNPPAPGDKASSVPSAIVLQSR